MAKPPPNQPRMPTIVPTTLVALDRAIVLLGARSKGETLRASKVQEIVGLLGRYPDPITAGAWKTELKSLLKTLRSEKLLDHAG